ncbi:YlxR family protein [Actinotalea solisilvae]|uniref:YlxR family protein n=1 Tax=Actinotalea solisilvae TaxID=2072922 RepID=UPI0027DC5167|nr:YlxR family protein [Actinotalea solisilvae]
MADRHPVRRGRPGGAGRGALGSRFVTDRARLGEAGPRDRHPVRAPGPDEGPVRTCVGCRQRGLRSVLLRVVRDEDGVRAVPDPGRRRPGRGAWLHADLACLDLAERRRALPRALHAGPLDTGAVREHLEALAGP